MRTSVTVFLLLAQIIPGLLAVHWKSPYFKSFDEAQQECAEYLRIPSETVAQYVGRSYPDEQGARNLVHCTLVNLHVWDETTGIREYAIRNFFQPACSDSCYENRTRECLRSNVSSLTNDLQVIRAYRSFLCYYRNYGQLVQSSQFLPYSEDAHLEAVKDSFAMQNVPRCVLQQYAAGNILDSAEFPDIYYTFVIRIGVYDPQVGFLTDPLYTELGDPGILLEQTKSCEASVRRQYCDEPARVFQALKQCYINYLPALPLFQKAASELLQESAVC